MLEGRAECQNQEKKSKIMNGMLESRPECKNQAQNGRIKMLELRARC